MSNRSHNEICCYYLHHKPTDHCFLLMGRGGGVEGVGNFLGHEVFSILTFRLCIIFLVGNSLFKNFFLWTKIKIMIVEALARFFSQWFPFNNERFFFPKILPCRIFFWKLPSSPSPQKVMIRP